MKRSTFYVLAAITGITIGCLLPLPKPVQTTHSAFRRANTLGAQMQSQTVSVVVEHGEGSGVVIKRGGRTFVWTAAHVVEGISKCEIHQAFRHNGAPAGEQVFPARVICRLPDTDVALLWVDAPPDKLAGAEWTNENLDVGTPVFACGNLRGRALDGSLSEGIVAQVGVSPLHKDGFPWPIVDQATVVAVPGSSGGPLFDSHGKLAGIVVGWPGMTSISFYVPLRVIYKAAQEANVTWAIFSTQCPPEHILKDAVRSATPEVERVDDFIKYLFGK